MERTTKNLVRRPKLVYTGFVLHCASMVNYPLSASTIDLKTIEQANLIKDILGTQVAETPEALVIAAEAFYERNNK